MTFFGPVSEPPPDKVDWPLPKGSSDYYELFDDAAAWADARDLLGAFKIHSWQARWYFTDDQLVEMSDFLDRHGIPLVVEAEPLDPPDPAECDHTESFEGPDEIETAQKLQALGVEVAAYAIEQPYHYGHLRQGPGACGYEVDRIVDDVVAWVDDLREVYPDVAVGSIEGLWSDPMTTAQDYEIWLDSYAEAAGEPFAFQHIDINWGRPDWVEATLSIEEVVESRGIPFGVIYNGGSAGSSDEWLRLAAERFATYERAGGTPDHTVFQSWVDFPDRVLPDSDSTAFSNLIVRHAGDRGVFDGELVVDPAAATVSGRLVDDGGSPLSDRTISADAAVPGRSSVITEFGGVVPSGATEALVAVRVNNEDAARGPANADLVSVEMRYADGDVNLVPNGDFADGAAGWGIYDSNTGSVTAAAGSDGSVLALRAASADEVILIDGERFPVEPGRSFDYRFEAQVASALSSGLVVVIFLDGDSEVVRVGRTELQASPIAVPNAMTDADGRFVLDLSTLPRDGAVLTVSTRNDSTTWPTSATVALGG